MEVSGARRLVSLLPPKLLNFFIRYPPRNPTYRTLYSKEDKSLLIARNLHDFLPIPSNLHKPIITTTITSHGKTKPTIYLPFQNPFKPSRDPRTGKFHGPRYSLRRQADIIKLGMRFGVAELLPPCDKMRRLIGGRRRPMAGTLYPKGTYEERTRQTYVEKKQKSLEEALRIVAMRKTVIIPTTHIMRYANLVCSGGQLRRVGNENLVLQQIKQNDTSDKPSYNDIHQCICNYNFAFFSECDFSYSITVFQANSPKGNIFLPYSLASALEACPLAALAAIPCEIILVLHRQKASANVKSKLGSQPASILYQFKIVAREAG